jgi:mRNA interferase RelE/StbE
MKVVFKKSFRKSLERLHDKRLKSSILKIIHQVESTNNVQRIASLKKLSGFSDFYRIRLGDYRIGLQIVGVTVIFVTFDHRKDIYKNFP